MAMLEVKNLGISFGGLKAVDGFYITIEKGQLYGLIGPNGAGKTTVFNSLQVSINPMRALFVWTGRTLREKRPLKSIRPVWPEPFRIFACLRI